MVQLFDLFAAHSMITQVSGSKFDSEALNLMMRDSMY